MRLVLKLGLVLALLLVLVVVPAKISAQQWCGGCQVTGPHLDPETGELFWIDGCNGCTESNCPSGQYEAPDGTCHDIGTGGGGGGGGAYQYPSCGGSQVVKCGTPNVYGTQQYPSETIGSLIPSCTYKAICGNNVGAGSLFTGNDCAGVDVPNRGSCQINCGCCNPGDDYVKNTVSGSNYTREVSCNATTDLCNDWDDVLVSRAAGASANHCYCTDDNYDGIARHCKDWRNNDIVTCRSTSTTWSCQSSCTQAAPSAPTLLTPAPVDGAVTNSLSGTLTWSAPASWGTKCPQPNTNSYTIKLNSCSASGSPVAPTTTIASNVSGTSNAYSVAGYGTYCWQVYATNGGLASVSTVGRFTVQQNTISGSVYDDGSNICSNSSGRGGVTVYLDGVATTTTAADGSYSMTASSSSSHTVSIGLPSGYICSTAASCSSGCPSKSSVSAGSVGNNFYLTQSREAWWQAEGAGVYAGGSVRSSLPSASSYLIEPGAGGVIGALMRSSGSVDTGNGAISTLGYNAMTTYHGKTMNYDYFAARMGVTPNTTNDWGADTMNKPANNPNKDFYYMDPSGSEASITSPWVVASGESYVVFVNGNLRIASPVTVANGGFVAFIVRGNLTVSSTVQDVQGIYDVDGTLTTESNSGADVQAKFGGSIVAWGGVNLGRDLDSGNITIPAEKFTYRPDLLVNMPNAMKVFALEWQELAPGSF